MDGNGGHQQLQFFCMKMLRRCSMHARDSHDDDDARVHWVHSFIDSHERYTTSVFVICLALRDEVIYTYRLDCLTS